MVICCSDFVSRRDHLFLILREDQWKWKIMDHDSDMLDAVGIMKDFFKQPPASVQIMAVLSFELFRFFWFHRRILFTSVPLYYFDLKSDWLPWLTFAFGSPPEDLLFLYLLFVPIRYHGFPNFSRRNVPQMQTSVFVQSTDFAHGRPFSRWLAKEIVIW